MNRNSRAVQRILTSAAGLLALAVMAAGTARAADCDRACLQDMLTKYVDAIVAHDPSRLPLDAEVRFTENSRDLQLGDGLWKTVTAKGDFRQDYIDTSRQIAASHVLLFEGDTEVIHSVVLHVAGSKISGIETLVYRGRADKKNEPHLQGNRLAAMNEPVPAAERMPRAAMLRVALTYTEGLRVGSFVKSRTPFAPRTYRLENGVRYAGEGCVSSSGQCDILTQEIMLHPDITSSVAAVDEEAGIVLLWMNFGDTNSYGPDTALVTFEAFKIHGGAIHTVNAFFTYLHKDTKRGWPSAE